MPTVVPVNDETIFREVRVKIAPNEPFAADAVTQDDGRLYVVTRGAGWTTDAKEETGSVLRLHKTLPVVLHLEHSVLMCVSHGPEHARRSAHVQRDGSSNLEGSQA